MKILKFFSLGSLLIVVINLFLAINASMNGTYNGTEVQRMVPFIFIFIASTVLYLMVLVIKKMFSKLKREGGAYECDSHNVSGSTRKIGQFGSFKAMPGRRR